MPFDGTQWIDEGFSTAPPRRYAVPSPPAARWVEPWFMTAPVLSALDVPGRTAFAHDPGFPKPPPKYPPFRPDAVTNRIRPEAEEIDLVLAWNDTRADEVPRPRPKLPPSRPDAAELRRIIDAEEVDISMTWNDVRADEPPRPRPLKPGPRQDTPYPLAEYPLPDPYLSWLDRDHLARPARPTTARRESREDSPGEFRLTMPWLATSAGKAPDRPARRVPPTADPTPGFPTIPDAVEVLGPWRAGSSDRPRPAGKSRTTDGDLAPGATRLDVPLWVTPSAVSEPHRVLVCPARRPGLGEPAWAQIADVPLWSGTGNFNSPPLTPSPVVARKGKLGRAGEVFGPGTVLPGTVEDALQASLGAVFLAMPVPPRPRSRSRTQTPETAPERSLVSVDGSTSAIQWTIDAMPYAPPGTRPGSGAGRSGLAGGRFPGTVVAIAGMPVPPPWVVSVGIAVAGPYDVVAAQVWQPGAEAGEVWDL